MSHPLDGARLKIIRAKEHLKSFNEDGGRYIHTEPYEIVSKIEGDYISIEGIVTTEPPPALACIIGDFVTNLRAALDYVAWELAIKFTTKTLTPKEERGISFPICSKAGFAKADGAAQSLGKVLGVKGAAAFAVIQSVQPYNAGYEPLDALDLLVRIDKHRTLLLCTLFMESAGNISLYRGDRLLSTFSGMSGMGINLTTSGPSVGSATEYSVKVNEKPTVYVALKDFPTPATRTYVGILEEVLKCVANIIPRFDQFF